MLKLASWNVNSLKIRLDQVLEWLKVSGTDILALQETKLMDEQFPQQSFADRHFHFVFSGQKTYNGVAIISKYPLRDIVTDAPDFVDPQRRILAATIGELRLINLYIPNGMAVGSEKYTYKLLWLEKVTAFIKSQLETYKQVAVVGDFNIAPEDRDVHDPEVWKDGIHVSPLERKAFHDLIALGLKDSFRNFTQEGQHFSWWDYRAGAFRRNHGLRIDHILLSEELNKQCLESGIDIGPRRAERPSDHAPVWTKLALDFV